VIIKPGGYPFTDAIVAYQLGLQRRVSRRIAVQAGEF
jgi:hypothetical protein